jgi:threonine dehydrogenase-like Zn-dependent dehydrogenase
MRAAIFQGKGHIEVGQRPDPVVVDPTDAVIKVVQASVCGSDLWYYRGATPTSRPAPRSGTNSSASSSRSVATSAR